MITNQERFEQWYALNTDLTKFPFWCRDFTLQLTSYLAAISDLREVMKRVAIRYQEQEVAFILNGEASDKAQGK